MSDCPLENTVAAALDSAGIAYVREHENCKATRHLDFLLVESGVFIEVKAFHTARVEKQMARADNVIVLQGKGAVALFHEMLSK